ncbi:hypothetical protein CR513_48935, partial [Mucuna pruriens]
MTFSRSRTEERFKVKKVIILMIIREFSKLVEKVKVVERLEPNPRVARTQNTGSSRSKKSYQLKKP